MAKAPTKKKTRSTTAKAPGKTAGRKVTTRAARETVVPETLAPRVREAEIIEPEIIEPEIIDPNEIGSEAGFNDPDLDEDEIERGLTSFEIDPDDDSEPKTINAPKTESKAATSKALAPADPVATYLAEIRRYPLLTKEQEQELAIRYRETGDPRAAELLVTSNLRFVVKIAAEYSRFGAKLIDLIQEGNVGLMHAVKEFNPYKGVRLITYAVWWIRGYIQEYLMRQYSMVRIGTTQNQRKLFYRLQKERELLESMGKEAGYALLSSRLGVSEEEVETMAKRLSGRDVSLNQPLDNGQSAATLLDFESSDDESVDDRIGHLEEMQVLNENLEKIRTQLNEKELYLLEKRVLADEPQTLQEIGEHFGVTREAVRQLEARLIGKIRTAVTASLNDSDDDHGSARD